MEQILKEYVQLLWSCFKYDIEVFKQVWIYACVLIPVIAYFVFFGFKWAVLLMPIWYPLHLVLGGGVKVIKLVSKVIKE